MGDELLYLAHPRTVLVRHLYVDMSITMAPTGHFQHLRLRKAFRITDRYGWREALLVLHAFWLFQWFFVCVFG